MSMKWLKQRAKRLWGDESGAYLIEYVIVLALFLLVFFALIDFGRLGFNWVMTEKAMQRAARIATVRPPVCANVPEIHNPGATANVRFGTLCRGLGANGGVCEAVPTRSCTLLSDTAYLTVNTQAKCDALAPQSTSTGQEIWCVLQPILPSNAEPKNIRVAYTFDENLGFLGGPYTPMVEVSIVTDSNTVALGGSLDFTFLTPLGGLAALAGGVATGVDVGNTMPFPDLSVSLPGEDLNHGNGG